MELFPTNVRTSAMGILAATGRCGAIIAQFINGSLEKNISLLILITSICTIIGGSISWLLPKDKTGIALIDYDNTNTTTSTNTSTTSTTNNNIVGREHIELSSTYI